MAKAIKRPAESWSYVLRADRELEESERSIFVLAPLTYAERAAMRDDVLRGKTDRVYREAGDVFLSHVVSIENFPGGNPVPWPSDRDARVRYLELLDDLHVLEVGNEIWARSSIGEDEDTLKNFSPLELTSSSGESSTATPASIPAPPATSTLT